MNRKRRRSEVILIGPPAAGKSTIAGELCKSLSAPVVSLDELAKAFLPELGFDVTEAEARFAQGFSHWRAYVAKFEVQLLSISMKMFEDCIFDIGAGFVVADHDAAITSLPSQALKGFSNVVHVTPALESQLALTICYERLCQRNLPDVSHAQCMEIARYFSARSEDFERLATVSVVTQNESPAQSVIRILKCIS